MEGIGHLHLQDASFVVAPQKRDPRHRPLVAPHQGRQPAPVLDRGTLPCPPTCFPSHPHAAPPAILVVCSTNRSVLFCYTVFSSQTLSPCPFPSLFHRGAARLNHDQTASRVLALIYSRAPRSTRPFDPTSRRSAHCSALLPLAYVVVLVYPS